MATSSSALQMSSSKSNLGASDTMSGSNTMTSTATGTKRRTLQKKKPKKPKEKAYITCSRVIVSNKYFVALTTALTFYALIGDDMRLLTTELPSDKIFDGITLACIVIFFSEVGLQCFGKDDYIGSFFFALDLISTATLVFDLSWVSNAIQGDDEQSSSGGATGTAKIGARTARVVRVLRLVRILKLYKAVFEARQAQKKRAEALHRIRSGEAEPGESDDNWEADADPDSRVETLQRGESRVGKRLSDLTTRRVIILVLSMMLFLPLLAVQEEQQLPFSPFYGADLVYDSFERWEGAASGTTQEQARKKKLHNTYVNDMLTMIYYNNWYTGHLDRTKCPQEDALYGNMYYNMLFWVGIVSYEDNPAALAAKASACSLTGTEPATFEQWAKTQNDLYNLGTFPSEVQKTLTSPWAEKCNTKNGKVFRTGLSLIKDELKHGEVSVSYAVRCPEDLRRVERRKFFTRIITKAEAKVWHIGFYFDTRQLVQEEALFSLGITSFVCVVLCVASIMFSADADKLVLHPVEQMISKVEKIRDNPLMAMKMSDEEFRQEEVRKAKEKLQGESQLQKYKDCVMCAGKPHQAEPMETVILEKTIIKIGSLLALGFGEAGANIIEHNMSGVDSAMVTAMVEGTRVECIIGTCRIRDFSTATEVLRGRVMTFVNQIAEIVHGVVDELHGAANKNNGEYFLLIWRTSELNEEYSQKLADMSMLSFTRILGSIHRSPVLASYRINPGLQMRLRNHCRVNCSFALHYGWAIEGAVGSEFKIDASYLSPHVSISESLEGATYIYGVNILISEMVIKMCTPQMAAKCRLIDKVLLTGTTMELYCIDLDYMSLQVEPPFQCPPWNPRQRFRCRQFLEQEKAMKFLEEVQIVNMFNENPDVATMRFRYTLEFSQVFNMGYQNYSEGEWKVAQRFLSLTRTMLGTEDGPSAALLRFMETPYKFEKPPGWRGIRDLGVDNLGL